MTISARAARHRPPATRRAIAVRIRVRLRRRQLDRRLAAGSEPDGSPELTLRALQLTSTEERRVMAATLDTLVGAADEHRADPTSILRIAADDVHAARDDLGWLAGLLRSDVRLTPRAVAQASLLAYDPASPIYQAIDANAIPHAIAQIHATLLDSPPGRAP